MPLSPSIELTVETLEVHTHEDDPFSHTLDSGDLLDELEIYRRDSPFDSIGRRAEADSMGWSGGVSWSAAWWGAPGNTD
jgi:hypothetical protein